MKLKIFLIGGLVLITSLIQINAQQVQESLLEGKWLVNFEKTLEKTEGERINKYHSLEPRIQESLKNTLSLQSFTFDSDHSFFAAYDNLDYEGTWMIDSEILSLNYQSGTIIQLKILQLSQDILLINVVDPAPQDLFNVFYLEKQSASNE